MTTPRWQPVVLVLTDGQRLECKCGALAVFVSGQHTEEMSKYNQLDNIDCWCQDCYQQMQEEDVDN